MRFVARQPILTADEKVFGYELLFRDGVENCFVATNIDLASRHTLDSSLLMGFDVLCDGHFAFVNCTRSVLVKDYVTLLPPCQTVVEVLETVAPDEEVRNACLRLKEAGYRIALDDFVANDPRESLCPIADLIKVDLTLTCAEERAAMVKRFGSSNCRLLAEKVETRKQFLEARELGFSYFQGYFFRRPEVLQSREIPGNQINYLRLLQAVARPELNAREIESILKSEASLCYRLLRYLNSPIFGLASEIHSVRHALSMLGEREVRRWVRLATTLAASQNKASEILLAALVRARFCELLSPRINPGEADLFLMGLLSLLDAILEIPIAEILERVPVDHETKEALTGGASRLRPLYDLMVAWELGEWPRAIELARTLHLKESEVAETYWSAMQWARGVTGAS